jgi:DNA-directed RNA polymerase specialized sigma24 family protein
VVFDAYAKSVYNHAFRLTGDWSVAEDVMAATFLEAWRARQRITEDGGSLCPWLLGIATNLTRSHRRASRRYRKAVERLPVLDGFPDFADDLTGRLDDAARVAALHRALANLHLRSWRFASGLTWATRTLPRPWASRLAPSARACPVLGRGWPG